MLYVNYLNLGGCLMGKEISVIVKLQGEKFGVYPSIKAAAIAVEDYFENT